MKEISDNESRSEPQRWLKCLIIFRCISFHGDRRSTSENIRSAEKFCHSNTRKLDVNFTSFNSIVSTSKVL